MRTTIWHLFLIWLIADLMDKSHVDCNFKPPDSQSIRVHMGSLLGYPCGLQSGWRDLNSRPHGPEPVSEILNCSPHGLVIFITMWSTFLGNHVDYDEPKTML